MKIHQLVAIAGLLVLPSLGFSQDYLAQTSTNQWTVDRNITITGSASTIGVQGSGVGGTLGVAQYSGGVDLTRVIIKVLQPAPSASPTISATLSVAEAETATFTNSANNRLQESSSVLGSTELSNAIAGIGGVLDEYGVTKNSATYANASITYPNTLSRSINITQTAITLFDSADFAISSAQLNSVFAGLGLLNFDYLATSTLNWNQTSPSTISVQLTGANTGQIVIEYYVPEPGTAVLVGLGGMMLLMRRRRRLA